MMDSWDGAMRHVPQRLPLYMVAKSPIARLEAWARERGWERLVFLSTLGNSYDADYFGDSAKLTDAMRKELGYEDDGKIWDQTMYNVFRRDGDTVRHCWGSEIVYAPSDPGQDHRAGDLVDPVWGFFDMSPEGRGDFEVKRDY